MKIWISSLVLLGISAFGNACPNVSGEYQFLSGGHLNRHIVVEQTGCDFVSWRWADVPEHVFAYKTDGAAYEGLYNYGPKEIPASLETRSFYRAQFLPNGIAFRTFGAPQKICGSDYHFGWSENPECPMYENSLRYDEGTKSYLWVNTGYLKTPHGYSVDTFTLRRVN